MPVFYPGNIISATEPTISSTRASGMWSMTTHMQKQRSGTWPATSPNVIYDANFSQTTLLLKSVGANTQQNYTFLDSSTNNSTVTRNGDVTQGSFSPFSIDDGKWSVYFDGNGDYLNIASNSAFNLTGDFTIEYWFYDDGSNLTYPTVVGNATGWTSGSFSMRYNNTGLANKVSIHWNPLGDPYLSSGVVASRTWHHVAFTRSGTTVTLWVNGVSQATATTSTALNLSFGGLNIGWSAWDTTQGYYKGYVSNVRVINGTALYTTNFTPSTTPLTAISGTSLLACQSNRFKDNSTNNFTITRNGDTKISALTPFNQNNSYLPSTNGGSSYFDGTGDWLSVASTTALGFGTGDYTIEFWLYLSASPSSGSKYTLLDFRPSDTAGTHTCYVANSGGTLYLGFYNGSSDITSSSQPLAVGSWYHCVWSRASGTIRIFVNGVQAYSGANSIDYQSSRPLFIGASSSSSFREPMTGYMSNLRIIKGTAVYTSAFTPPAAPLTAITNTSLLLSGTNAGIVDAARKGVVYTHGQTKVNTSVYKYEKSIEFTGSSESVLTIPNSENFYLGNSDFTIETWVNLTAIQLDRAIITKGWQNTMPPFLIYTKTGDNSIRFASSSNEYSFDVVGSLVIGQYVSTGTWHHIAVTRSGNTFRSFFNGVNTANTTSSGIPHNAAGYPITIGGSNAKADLITGYIEDMRITRGYARYTANFTPPTTLLPSA